MEGCKSEEVLGFNDEGERCEVVGVRKSWGSKGSFVLSPGCLPVTVSW